MRIKERVHFEQKETKGTEKTIKMHGKACRLARHVVLLVSFCSIKPFPNEQDTLEAEPCRGFACEARCWSTPVAGARLSSRASQATPLQKSDFHWEWV
jgi:hypothetical protein